MDESRENTISELKGQLTDLKRKIRTISNAIEYLERTKRSQKIGVKD